MADGNIGLWTVPLAVLGGAIRVSTPFLFVSLGECITERSGRINLGLEGTLVMGAMRAYGIFYLTGSPRLGGLGAALAPPVLCARRARRWHHRCASGRAACRHLLAAARQRRRGRHRADVVRHRTSFLPRQAVDRADGTSTARNRFRLVERHSAGARGPTGQRAVPDRRRTRANFLLGLPD